MNKKNHIPFNRAYIAGRELYYISQAVLDGEIKGDGQFTKRCNEWFEKELGIPKVLLTTSCTAALEMAGILLELQPGDEVLMPSFTFTSTANAFLLRGARPVFVDIREDTLNIDEKLIAPHLTGKSRVICPVHYAGVGCEMDYIMELAKRNNLFVVEDAAHAVLARYKGKPLGTFGDLSAFSFHETKNYSSGEGGALLINDPRHTLRAEIIREKGTNRSQFFRGEVDKYTWIDIGSSFLPSEIVAAFLYAQLENAYDINNKRLAIWNFYFNSLKVLEDRGVASLPIVPPHCEHNAHLFYLMLNSQNERDELLARMRSLGIGAVFHYVPLHLSPMGEKFGYRKGDLPKTESLASRLIRLPLFPTLEESSLERICSSICEFFGIVHGTKKVANI